jgi:hypothetical protein
MDKIWISATHTLAALVLGLGALATAMPAMFDVLPTWAKLVCIGCGAYGLGLHQTAPKDAALVKAAKSTESAT